MTNRRGPDRVPFSALSISLLTSAWLLAGLSPAFAGEGLARVQQRGELVWGGDQEGGGPFVFPAPNDPNRLEGFEVELAQLLAEQMGVRPKFAQGQWDKLPELLDRGDIDVVLNGYEWTPAWASRYGCSIPYYIYELQLLGRKDDQTLRSWGDVGQPPDGAPKRIAVLKGSAAERYLTANYPSRVEIASYEGATEAMRGVELEVDGIDGNLQDLPVWLFYREGFGQLAAVGDPVGKGYYVAMVKQGEPELLGKINDGIRASLMDGRLRKIYSKYRIWNQTQSARGLETEPDNDFTGDLTAEEAPLEGIYVPVTGWSAVVQRGPLLFLAAQMTVLLSVVSMPLAVLLGLIIALIRRYGPGLLATPATAYVELVRGTPLVLQLYVIFFLLPELGVKVNAFWAAVAGLAINYSAYEAEIYRAGFQAIPKGQMEAALALGFSKWKAIRRIIIPQATRLVIPPVTNDFIALFKDTAVCSVITIVELSKQYSVQARSTGAIVELGAITALLYLSMSYPLSLVAGRLEKKLLGEHQA